MTGTCEDATGRSPAATPPGVLPCGLRPDELPPGWSFPEGWKPAPRGLRPAARDVVPATPPRARRKPAVPAKPAARRKPKPDPPSPPPAQRPPARTAVLPAPRPPSAPLPRTLVAPSAPTETASRLGLSGLVGPAWTPGRTKEPRNSGAAPIGPTASPDHGPRPTPLQPARHDPLAVAALVLAVLWLAGVGSLAAVVVGTMSRSRARQDRRLPSGVASAGVRLGWVGLVAVPVVFLLALPAYQSSRDASGSAAVKDALVEVGKSQEQHRSSTGRYASSLPTGDVVVVQADESGYCLRATSSTGEDWYLDELRGTPSTAPC